MSRNAQNLLYGKNREVIVALQDTAYETVAEGFGVKGVRVNRYEDIAPAVQEAFASGEPRLINLIIDAAVMHPRTRMMVGDTSGNDGVPIPYYANIPK
jgi:acetolactate synthase-1/2/3 large subunit